LSMTRSATKQNEQNSYPHLYRPRVHGTGPRHGGHGHGVRTQALGKVPTFPSLFGWQGQRRACSCLRVHACALWCSRRCLGRPRYGDAAAVPLVYDGEQGKHNVRRATWLTVRVEVVGWRCGGVSGPCRVGAVQGEQLRRCSQTGRRPPLQRLW
jgi:hypothetical protein